MKKILIAALGMLVLSGCASDSNFSIKVSGSGKFSGAIMVVTAGKSESHSIEGTAPASYSEHGSLVSVSFQKKEKEGHLEVEITKDGKSVGKQSTDAEYGVVSVAGQ